MTFLWALIGAAVGLILDQSLFAALTGAVLGLLWARQGALAKSLEAAHAARPEEAPPSRQGQSGTPDNSDDEADAPWGRPPARSAAADAAFAPEDIPAEPAPAFAAAEAAASPAMASASTDASAAPVAPPAPLAATELGLLDRAAWRVRDWFTSGNVPVKVGVLVLFAGVAALLKYAHDQALFTIPLALRVSAVAAAALAALAFGWHQRERRRSFALSLQGGAIGVLVLVVFASFRLYELLPQGPAFVLLALLVAAAGALAVWQDALALAVLGLVAGFAAPILVTTGHGSHVALFGFYTVLNLGIFGIAWLKSWRVLNLMGFVATFVIATAWGVLRYQPAYFASIEPFLIFNFLLYLVIPWLYLRRRFDPGRKVVDGALLFGNPLICLLLQASLLEWQALPLAGSAIAAALVYAVAAWSMRRRAHMDILFHGWAVLAGVFATLAVPLALGADLTASVFALEGAAIVWLGLRQQRRITPWLGLLVQLLAAAACLSAYGDAVGVDRPAVFNGPFLAAMLVVAASAVSSWLYQRHSREQAWMTTMAVLAAIWGLLWWLGATGLEMARVLEGRELLAGLWTLLAVTAWGLAEVARRLGDTGLLARANAWLAAGLSLLLPVLALGCLLPSWQLLAGWLLAAVALSAALGWRMLLCLRACRGAAVLAQLGWWWRWAIVAGVALVVALEPRPGLADSWLLLAGTLPAVVLWLVALRRGDWLAPPLPQAFTRTRRWLQHSLALALIWVFLPGLLAAGDAAPLAFVPVFNPLEVLLLAIAACFVYWTALDEMPADFRRLRPMLLGTGAIVLATSMTLRAVHQLAGVPWGHELFDSSLAQMSLTVVWSAFGVLAWLWGSRRQQFPVWMVGAVAMGVVLLKLLLVDRESLGNLFGIASFLAYGMLCVGVGYLAPVPPRKPRADTASAADQP